MIFINNDLTIYAMLLHKVNQIELSDKEIDIIEQIKLLKSEIDILCSDLVETLYKDNIDVEYTQDIMFFSGLVEIVGRVEVNKFIKNTYKIKN
jgi:uncharacterized protein Yka (UPF0111/DUF47 family)